MIRLWCIHGNLQLPTVWKSFEGRFRLPAQGRRQKRVVLPLELVNLWNTKAQNFDSWAAGFCNHVERTGPGAPQLLVGYSLGGRLALHAVLHKPELWWAAIVVGAETGYKNDALKQERLERDQEWGRRFLFEDWEELLAEWDGQDVFAGRPNLDVRREIDFSREDIQRLFGLFSKGRQQDLLPALSALREPPILFVTGEEDYTYRELGLSLASVCPTVHHAVVTKAAHRVPWDNPTGFTQAVQTFIDRLSRSRLSETRFD